MTAHWCSNCERIDPRTETCCFAPVVATAVPPELAERITAQLVSTTWNLNGHGIGSVSERHSHHRFDESCALCRPDEGIRLVVATVLEAAGVAEVTAERDRWRTLAATLASSAARYDCRVYQIGQYPELLEYLTEDDLAANQERPSDTDQRVIGERDRARDVAVALEQEVAEVRERLADVVRILRRPERREATVNRIEHAISVGRTALAGGAEE